MKPFFSLHYLLLSGLFLLHDGCCNLKDGYRSINSGHSCWLLTAPDPARPSSAGNIYQNTHAFSHADVSCIKRGPLYSEGACSHYHPPVTSCAYDTHLSGPTDSLIRPDNMPSEVGAGPYPQQGLTTSPVTVQHRTPSGGLLHVGDEATPTPPPHAIKLMGVLISPEVAPNLSKIPASIKHNENVLSSPSATAFSSQDHTGTGDVAVQPASSGVISGQQDQLSPERTGWEPLKFDVSVFESSVADGIDQHKIRQIWELISRLKSGPQLQMNTREFRRFHTKVFRTFLQDNKGARCKIDYNAHAAKCVFACRALYGNREFWFRRWDAMLDHPRRLAALRLQLQRKTQHEAFALMFLFFVEMICVVIRWDEKAVNGQLHTALEMLEELFHPTTTSSSSSSSSSSVRLSEQASESHHHSAPLHLPKSPQPTLNQSDILTLLARRDNFYIFCPLWLLLKRWLFTHRKLFAKEIMPQRTSNIQHVKMFFNNIFYLSIHNLNRKFS